MIIDFHAHIYPEKIAAKAVANICAFYNIPMGCDGTVGGLLKFGNREGESSAPPLAPRQGIPLQGIDHFVVFSAAAAPGQVASINDFIARTAREHPELTGFGTLHPDLEDPAAEIERLIGLVLRGLNFHPDMQRLNIAMRGC